MPIIPPEKPCTDVAKELVLGQRNIDYGHPLDNFIDVAAGWSALVGTPITAEQVPLMMEWLKMCRQKQSLKATGRYHKDTQADSCGYVLTGQVLEEERDRRRPRTKPPMKAAPASARNVLRELLSHKTKKKAS